MRYRFTTVGCVPILLDFHVAVQFSPFSTFQHFYTSYFRTSRPWRDVPGFVEEKWITFLSQLNFELSQNTRLCVEHFEEKYIKYEAVRNHLKWNMMPIPTIHSNDEHDLPISPSSLSVPKTPRNGPRKGLFQEDQMYDFIERDQIKDFA